MMISFIELQNKIYEYGERINAPRDLLRVFGGPQSDGTPYVEVLWSKYVYASEERGREFDRRETDDLDLLCYWIMELVVSTLSYDYELRNRKYNQDSRRIAFAKMVELMGILSPVWRDRMQESINETLKNAPYRDVR